MKTFNWLILTIPLFIACNNGNKVQKEIAEAQTTIEADTTKGKPTSFFFSGDFIYMADAASLKDCITGAVFPVVMKGAYKEVERKYNELNPEPLETINCSVMGYLVDKQPGEEGPNKQLLITGLVGFDRSVTCNDPDKITNATFIHYSPDEKNVKTITKITFNPDYTYKCCVYKYQPADMLSKTMGHWHRMAKDNIVLLTDGDVLYEGNIDFSNMSLLLQNDNEKEVVFKKGPLLK